MRHDTTQRLRRILRKNYLLRKAYRVTRAQSLRLVNLTRKHQFTYSEWITTNEPGLWDTAAIRGKQPLISIVVPTFNTPDKYLEPFIRSVISQNYQHWQLCVADGSTDSTRSKVIKAACQVDKRISYKKLAENHGIVGNTNEAIDLAEGEFIGFLDHDDCLAPQALGEIVRALKKQPKTDIFYSDEDKMSDNGLERTQPFFKPDWSPTLEESVNYLTHFLVVRRSVVEKVGKLQEGFEGAQDYEFILRATDHTKNIVHIPKILYHWRLADGSTSGLIGNKSYADSAGQKALAEHIKRQKIAAKVLAIPDMPTNYRLQYAVPKGAKVSIIIPFKDKVDLLKVCLASILSKTTYTNFEIILISNNSTNPKTHKYLKTLKGNKQIKIFYWNHTFNFSAINNFGRRQATGDYLVLLNNDTKVMTPEWLEELIGVASQPNVGAVGPLLLYPSYKIQHAGVILGMNTMAGHVFRHQPQDALTAFGRPYWPRNYLAVTAACLAVKASKYDEVGGLDEVFTVAGNDVAFGISLYEKGYLNVYWPFVKVLHYESVSVGTYDNGIQLDYDHSLTYYQPYLNWKDPYFNPSLDLMNEQVDIRKNYE
ncbi:MAG TPA: glycosyltransferase [Candidatus Saccharimonadales bacterium]